MMVSNPTVEIIILTHNGEKNVDRCLNSVLKTDYDKLLITVVDNASTDNTSEILHRYKEINLIESSKNIGFVGGNNLAMKRSKAKYLVLLNDDTMVDKYWVKELVKVAEADESVVALQPKVLWMMDASYFEYAGAAGSFMDIFGYTLCRGRVFDVVEKDLGQYDNIIDIFWASGVAMFIRRSALEKIGYLDEDFFIYAEEVDLCWRMHLAGYKVKFVPMARIYHLGRATMSREEYKFRKEYLLHRNHLIILFKNYRLVTLLFIIPCKVLLEILAFFAFLFRAPLVSWAILSAFGWIIIKSPLMIRKNYEVKKIRKLSDYEVMGKMIWTSIPLSYYIFGKKSFRDFEKFINI